MPSSKPEPCNRRRMTRIHNGLGASSFMYGHHLKDDVSRRMVSCGVWCPALSLSTPRHLYHSSSSRVRSTVSISSASDCRFNRAWSFLFCSCTSDQFKGATRMPTSRYWIRFREKERSAVDSSSSRWMTLLDDRRRFFDGAEAGDERPLWASSDALPLISRLRFGFATLLRECEVTWPSDVKSSEIQSDERRRTRWSEPMMLRMTSDAVVRY